MVSWLPTPVLMSPKLLHSSIATGPTILVPVSRADSLGIDRAVLPSLWALSLQASQADCHGNVSWQPAQRELMKAGAGTWPMQGQSEAAKSCLPLAKGC